MFNPRLFELTMPEKAYYLNIQLFFSNQMVLSGISRQNTKMLSEGILAVTAFSPVNRNKVGR